MINFMNNSYLMKFIIERINVIIATDKKLKLQIIVLFLSAFAKNTQVIKVFISAPIS